MGSSTSNTYTDSWPAVTYLDGCAGASSPAECRVLKCPKGSTGMGKNGCSLTGAFTVLGTVNDPIASFKDCQSGTYVPFDGTKATGGLCAQPYREATGCN